MRISDWSSDVCSSDLLAQAANAGNYRRRHKAVPVLVSQAAYLVGWDNDFVAELLLARAKTYARDPCRGPHTVTKHLLGRPRQTVKRLRQVARYFCPRLALGLRWALTSRETSNYSYELTGLSRSEEHT